MILFSNLIYITNKLNKRFAIIEKHKFTKDGAI